jgi:hypothetical protein
MGSFSFFHWVIAIIIIGLGFLIVATPFLIILRAFKGGKPRFCTACGHEGTTRTETRGSIAIEVFLWLLLIIPGILYSLWRLSTRKPVCAECGSHQVVPVTSPVAVKMRRELAA